MPARLRRNSQIIDEIGYLAFDQVQASLLFRVICRRYQQGVNSK